MAGRYRLLMSGAALAAAYWITAVIGLQWAAIGAGSPVWPAAGVALAGLLIGGVRLWPAIIVGRLAAALTIGSPHPLLTDLLIAGGNALAAVLPALALQGARLDLRLCTMRDMLWLIFAGAVGAAIAAIIGTLTLWVPVGFDPDRAATIALNWWFGNLVGTLTLTPLILTWCDPEARVMGPAAWAHALALLAASVLLSYLVFLSPSTPFLRTWHTFPVLVWAALAFQVRGAAVALAIVSALSIWGAPAGGGPFITLADSPAGQLFFAQQFSAIACVTTLLLAAVADERRGKEALRQSEQRLKRSEERLRLAQTAGGIVTWEWDIRSGEVAWSGPMHRLLGLPEQWSASYSAFAQAIHPDDQGFVQERIQSALRGEQAYDCEFRIVRPKGEVRWLTARAEVVRDDAGEPVRMVGVNFDITRRKRAEEDLARFNADLERQVREDAAKLVQLQKMESVGQLTGGIAHDFNNLLMAVLGSLEILRKRLPEDPKLRRLIDNAIQGAERGAALTQRMLAFARRQDLKPQPVAIPELVGGMKDLLKRSLGPQIKIETRFALDAPKALVDPNQLELAILNLALNARDAMPEGGRLSIEVDEETISPGGSLAPGAYVRLRIVDSGTGMDEETLRRATEPFFTTKGVGKGTGLGLSMVHGLAEQSGGHFRLKSELGRGTCAEILLPVALEAVSPLGESVEALEAQEPRSSRPLSVLAVDDDAIVLTGTADMLEDLGHRAIKAPSGPAALDLLRSGERVDVVLTDQAMPGMTGVQLAREIRAEWPGLPVVLATGYAELPEGAGGLFARRLGKPFRQEQLAAALGRAVEAASGKVVPLRSRGG